MLRFSSVLILIVLIVALASAALALKLEGSLDGYESRYVVAEDGGSGGPETLRAGSRIARRVVMVVVDGLRDDTSYEMPFLNGLRQDWAFRTLSAGQPSYSKPGYAVLASGAWQEVNGVTSNFDEGPMDSDNIFKVLARAGMASSVVAYDWWREIAGVEFTYDRSYPDSHAPGVDDDALASALESLRTERPDLLVLHLSDVDNNGHDMGGAASPEYLQAALHADGVIQAVASELDFSEDVLIVTADHGHLAHNNGPGSGHGGWEEEVVKVPFVMAGKGVTPGSYAPGWQVDVAPTIAALLGVVVPREAQGRVMWDALDTSAEDKAVKEVARAQAYARFAGVYSRTVLEGGHRDFGEGVRRAAFESLASAETALSEGDYVRAFDEAQSAVDGFSRANGLVRQGRAASDRIARLVPGLVVLVGMAMLWWKIADERRLLTFALALVFLVLDHGAYKLVFGRHYSMGAFPDGSMATLHKLFGLPAYFAVLVVFVYLIWAYRTGRLNPGFSRSAGGDQIQPCSLACETARLMVAIVALEVAVAVAGYVWNGHMITWYMPDTRVAFVYLMTLLQLVFLAIPGILLPLVAVPLGAGRRPGEIVYTNVAPGGPR